MPDTLPIERHPWAPYIPANARMLIMGTFPPAPHRWCMNFYYPNPTNDFWKMMGLVFYGDPTALYNPEQRTYDLEEIKMLLNREGIALHDTCQRIRRLKGNASDKFLEVVEPVNLAELLKMMPECDTLVTTGEKAAQVLASLINSEVPKVGEWTYGECEPLNRHLKIWRMPSTSRAYPLALAKKAAYYARLFGMPFEGERSEQTREGSIAKREAEGRGKKD